VIVKVGCGVVVFNFLTSNNTVYRTIILSVVLYRSATWLLMLTVERRLWAFQNRVLRRIFQPKRDEVTGEWKELHNEALSNLYYSSNTIQVIKSRRLRWAGL